ncbi:hypothetical protein INT43_000409 [Umbelopsis isabellina]|uniref:Apoptogenic protein 1, mitochondrial n=1 Tax=Mortierella isabellina TaxID=91625 RepID=A0A8H7Q391_MORIS|nr:hypothetical protein INT43_000409 [Umbelopsis isabellina]
MLKVATTRFSARALNSSVANQSVRLIHTTKPSDDLNTEKLHSPINDILSRKVEADMIGTPDPVSNLRPVRYFIPLDESPEDKEWRLHRQRVDDFNESFWSANNALFINAQADFEDQSRIFYSIGSPPPVRARGEKVTAEALSVFYKDFLDKAYERQMAYNKQWWKENIGMLYPGAKAAMRQLTQKRKHEVAPLSFWDKNFE